MYECGNHSRNTSRTVGMQIIELKMRLNIQFWAAMHIRDPLKMNDVFFLFSTEKYCEAHAIF